MGTGILNWVFALPAFLTIDTFGRRNLLLFTFPFLALTNFWTGFSFWIKKKKPTRVGMVTTGMYLFEVFYSPGMGPVPFTYSAEAFPLHVREIGMSFATATVSIHLLSSLHHKRSSIGGYLRAVARFEPQGHDIPLVYTEAR